MSARNGRALAATLAVALACAPAWAVPPTPPADGALPGTVAAEAPTDAAHPPHLRSGAEIYAAFRDGLAEPECPADSASPRWSKHYAAAATRLAGQDTTLALFGYVVDELRKAHLPTEYALIPFVESGYKPEARSQLGPAGLWQFIALTARNHKVAVRAGYDGRLSPVESTRAAVRYLKTLHGMFAGDWRLASMGYNAGEYRILGALRRSGQVARDADPDALPGLSGITRAYPRKMHAISCLLQRADDDAAWMAALDRPVPRLVAAPLPAGTRDLDRWARDNGLDTTQLRRLNPAFRDGKVVRRGTEPLQVLAPATAKVEAVESVVLASPAAPATAPAKDPPGAVHAAATD